MMLIVTRARYSGERERQRRYALFVDAERI